MWEAVAEGADKVWLLLLTSDQIHSFPTKWPIKIFGLIVAESALQPGDSGGGHVAE